MKHLLAPAALLVAGCASWHRKLPAEVNAELKHVLIVTDALAVELDTPQVDAAEIRGAMLRAWSFPPAAAGVFAPADASPDDIAAQLGWQRRADLDGQIVHIPRARVRYASAAAIDSGRTATVVATSVVLLYLLARILTLSWSYDPR